MSYLQQLHGEEGFKKAYMLIREISSELSGEIDVPTYEKALKGVMTAEEIKGNLFLYLALLNMEQKGVAGY